MRRLPDRVPGVALPAEPVAHRRMRSPRACPARGDFGLPSRSVAPHPSVLRRPGSNSDPLPWPGSAQTDKLADRLTTADFPCFGVTANHHRHGDQARTWRPSLPRAGRGCCERGERGNINYTSGCREHHCLDRAKLRQARVREGRYLLRNQFRRGRPGQTAESLTAAGDGVGSVQEPERRPRDPAGLLPARGAHRGELSPTRRGIATASRGCLCFLRKSGSTATDDEGGPRYRRVRF